MDLVKALQNVSYDSVTIHDYSYSKRWVGDRVGTCASRPGLISLTSFMILYH